MIRHSWQATPSPGGFTLIEVIGALVIFSLGVLMVMQVSDALGTQMRHAGVRSEIVVLAEATLDSLEALPASSLTASTTTDTITSGGIDYECTVVVTLVTAALARIDVSIDPLAGAGPSYSITSYTSEPW